MVAPNIIPAPTKEPRQRSLDLSDVYLIGGAPTFIRPNTFTAKAWRAFVQSQPIAVLAREVLISKILALDWKISAKDSDQRDELKPTIRYYTRLLDRGAYNGLDYSNHVEWVMKDLLDIPFGGASEIGRKNDSPNGRLVWIRPLDGGTLYPTLNMEYPVVQYYFGHNPIPFPQHAIARVFMSPHTDIEREGWGMAPPEKIYLAMQMVGQGDSYYANLLLDIPPVGILDLADMEKGSAIEWVDSYRTFLMSGGQKSFKIPVLYEHNNDVKFISFGKNPNEIMFDSTTLRYAAIVAAGYGLTLGDLGSIASSGSGETLAGTIRDQRNTNQTGRARVKKKMKYYFDSFLPDTLSFNFIDYDDELNVALGRARLANATASGQWIEQSVFSSGELRAQAIADGLITVSVPEKMPESERQKPTQGSKSAPERPGAIGTKEPASMGGMGEVVKSVFISKSKKIDTALESFVSVIGELMRPHLFSVLDVMGEDDPVGCYQSILHNVWNFDDLVADVPNNWLKFDLDDSAYQALSLDKSKVNSNIRKYAKEFLSKYILRELAKNFFLHDGIDIDNDDVYYSIVNSVCLSVRENLETVVSASLNVSIPTLKEMEK